MGYEPPSYKELQARTKMLEVSFNNLSNRYISPNYSTLYKKIQPLAASYLEKAKRDPSWFNSHNYNKRLDEINCITQLLDNKLENPNSRNEQNKQQSRQILLGSLFYHREQLKKASKEKYFILSSFFKSTLQKTIEEQLNINDKNKLDPETLVTCCQAFASYLSHPSASNQFADLKKDKDFMKTLNDFIDKNEVKAASTHKQLEFLSFVRSVEKLLEATDKKTTYFINLLSRSIINKFQQNKVYELTPSKVINYFDNLNPTPDKFTCALIKELLPTLPIKFCAQEKTLNFEENGQKISFQNYMLEALEIKSQYALLGAYFITLEKEDHSASTLTRTLHLALGINSNNLLDEETKELSLLALKKYLELPLPQTPAVEWQAWDKEDGEGQMKRTLEQQLSQSTHQLTAAFN